MNRILFEDKQDEYVLRADDTRLEHARNVLRVKPGDVLDIGVVNGAVGKGRVEEVTRDSICIAVKWGEVPLALPGVTLLIALSRPQTMKKVLYEATTLGVRRIVVFPAGRSDPAFGQSRLWQDNRWRGYLVEAAAQAFDTRIPDFRKMESIEAALVASGDSRGRWYMDVYGRGARLGAAEDDLPCALAIGPERGWNANDYKSLDAHGFHGVCMGKRVLRVETATVAALTIIMHQIQLM